MKPYYATVMREIWEHFAAIYGPKTTWEWSAGMSNRIDPDLLPQPDLLEARAAAVRAMPSLAAYEALVDDLLAELKETR